MQRFLLALGFVVTLAGLAAPALGAPPTEERPHEILSDRPSGFWTSNRPAVGGAYKWRLLEVGVGVCALTGFLMVRLIKKAKAPPEARVIPSTRRTTP
jgi:hypothetical protein